MPQDPVAFVNAFHVKWNAQDVDGVVDYFADDPVVRAVPPPPPPTPDTYRGKDDIRTFLQQHMDGTFHVDAQNQRLEGDKILWEFVVSSPVFRGMGVDPATGTVELVLDGEKIKQFQFTLDQSTLAKMGPPPG
jgi:hypothetical protein